MRRPTIAQTGELIANIPRMPETEMFIDKLADRRQECAKAQVHGPRQPKLHSKAGPFV
jgi:hypothetical protein